MNLHSIDSAVCKKCGLCIKVCPNKMLATASDGTATFIPGRIQLCMSCGQCMAVCNAKAVTIPGLSYEENIFESGEQTVDIEKLSHFMATRRSVRNFSDKPVPDDVLHKLLQSIEYAPYGSEHNGICVTVVRDRQKIAQALPIMSEFYRWLYKMLTGRMTRFFMKRKMSPELFNTLDKHLKPRLDVNHYDTSDGTDHITRNAPCVLIFHAPKDTPEHSQDGMIYVTYAALAAHALGLGACINGLVGAAVNKRDELRQIFDIPPENEVVISLLLGYPAVKIKKGIRHKNVKVLQ
ncbi:MAG: hypothetical protein CVU05_03270 [Bacteroidetes bacterium HGW-Bacteroidetes-21]|jgi:ferredoxin|nr:MAG: hypothetical protein CVU05_03270 [Bacteroidetes bacterium HGW-Bacteroidetes-21]